MPTFRIADVVNKLLLANKRLPIRRSPSEANPVVYWAEPNQSVGVLFSYVGGTPTNPKIWFQFYDKDRRPYYVDYEPQRFKLANLPNNPISIEERIKEEKTPPPKSLGDKVGNTVMLVGVAAAFYLFTKNAGTGNARSRR